MSITSAEIRKRRKEKVQERQREQKLTEFMPYKIYNIQYTIPNLKFLGQLDSSPGSGGNGLCWVFSSIITSVSEAQGPEVLRC